MQSSVWGWTPRPSSGEAALLNLLSIEISMRKAQLQNKGAKRRKNAAHGTNHGKTQENVPAPSAQKNAGSSQCVEIRVIPIPLENEIRPGDSIAAGLSASLRRRRLRLHAGDIVVIKHKIVSKAEGRIVDLSTITPSPESLAWAEQYKLDARAIELALRESRSVIRRKNGVLITETHHGFICANSGVDVSNVDGGRHAVLLPEDSDASAAKIRRALKKSTGLAIPVIITDSFGRPWREGLTEFAIGISGMNALSDYRNRRDPHGYKLKASVEAVADELACAAGLVCGKLNRAPACIIRGFRYAAGAGRARELLRPPATDLFR
jgi:coenzyme F420-0:L-glutamate ligase / coenzyme F420-1:gamma-L-glutamate ligase